tara:strand:+ start:336 stop:446 length:111 start_codon:yes stop_codon:yes gene_type:complete
VLGGNRARIKLVKIGVAGGIRLQYSIATPPDLTKVI